MHGLDLESCNDIMTAVVLATDGRFIKGEEVKPKNLFFILSDQHNRNVTGACGNPHVQTPNLDRFAEGGTLFTASYSGSPLCVPPRASLVTGLPSAHSCPGPSRAEEVAGAAVFLSGNGVSFITGEIVEINGGFWLA